MPLSSTIRTLLVVLVVVAAASFLPLGVSGYVLGLLTVAFYFGVFAMAWDLLFGFAGEVNFGPTFLIGTGAYTAGILDNLDWESPSNSFYRTAQAGEMSGQPAYALRTAWSRPVRNCWEDKTWRPR